MQGFECLILLKKPRIKSIPLPLWHCGAVPLTSRKAPPAGLIHLNEVISFKDTFSLSLPRPLVSGLERDRMLAGRSVTRSDVAAAKQLARERCEESVQHAWGVSVPLLPITVLPWFMDGGLMWRHFFPVV